MVAVLEGEEPLQADAETRHAIEGYRDAMTYVLQLGATPPMPPIDATMVRALHFMMLRCDLTRHPGQWRPGAVWVQDQDGSVVYQAPDRAELDDLVAEVLVQANGGGQPPVVAAAMAHLNLALVHPFSDGNGRMARCLQSYVLAGEGVLSPEFVSIEEYLGRNTSAYYAVLTEVAQGSWSPERDARPWLRFSLTAHHRQALTVLRRIEEAEVLWDRCERLAQERHLPPRTVAALVDAARGWRLRRSLYVKTVRSASGEEITDATATRDLAAITGAGLLTPVGEKRGRSYEPTAELTSVWHAIQQARRGSRSIDPYATTSATTP